MKVYVWNTKQQSYENFSLIREVFDLNTVAQFSAHFYVETIKARVSLKISPKEKYDVFECTALSKKLTNSHDRESKYKMIWESPCFNLSSKLRAYVMKISVAIKYQQTSFRSSYIFIWQKAKLNMLPNRALNNDICGVSLCNLFVIFIDVGKVA